MSGSNIILGVRVCVSCQVCLCHCEPYEGHWTRSRKRILFSSESSQPSATNLAFLRLSGHVSPCHMHTYLSTHVVDSGQILTIDAHIVQMMSAMMFI